MAKDYLYDPKGTPLNRHFYRPPEYTIKSTRLHINLDEEKTRVKSGIWVERHPDMEDVGGPLILDGQNMNLISVKMDGKTLDMQDFSVNGESLTIKRPPNRPFHLEIVTEVNPKANTRLEGIYMAGDILCSQCEAQGFRNITYYLDRPDVLSKFTVTLEGDKQKFPTLLSNGNANPHQTKDLGNGRHSITWQDPHPKPSYLFAVVGGDMKVLEDKFTTMSGKEVDLRIFVQPGYEDKIQWAMDSIKRSMKWDEEKYGREYDLDCFHVVAVDKFNAGAMENKGLNVFNVTYLLGNPDTATDDELIDIEAVIGHEYFHNWTGDRVTVRDWFELTLKEGLTVLRDRQFTADMHSAAIKTIDDANTMQSAQFVEDSGSSAHPIRPDRVEEFDNIYSGTVYEKGSHVLGMLKTLIGDKKWRAAMDEYFDRFDGQAVTCDDFVNVMEQVSGKDLTQFRRWYEQSGTPVIHYEGKYNADKKTYTLTLTQHTPETADQKASDKKPLHIPVAVGLIAESGKDVPLNKNGDTTHILELTKEKQTFVFKNVKGPVVPSVLRGFSAPVRLATRPSDDELLFRMSHDSDPYNKYEAFQSFATKTLLNLVKDIEAGKEPTLPRNFVDAYGLNLSVAMDGDMDFAARTLSLPGSNVLTQYMETVDPMAVKKAISFAGNTLAKTFQKEFEDIYAQTTAPEGEKYDVVPEQTGRRSLRGVALHHLTRLKTPEAAQAARTQYQTATNMTERLSGLRGLLRAEGIDNARTELDDFYNKYKGVPNAVRNWIQIQVAFETKDGVKRAQEIMQHEAFDITNPNKLFALVGGLTGNNSQFHKQDGSGYAFLADVVIKLNTINPRTGARMVRPLTRWSRMKPELSEKMYAELQRIAATPDLDTTIGEVVRKALALKKPQQPDQKKNIWHCGQTKITKD